MSKVLLLDAAWRPVDVISVKDAWGKIEDGDVFPATDHIAQTLRTARDSFDVPSVLALKSYHNVGKRKIEWSKSAVLRRDDYTCIYCGERGFRSDMTIDHIIPKSKGGPDTWGNTACCCFDCNQRKADRSTHEAGMKLRWEPRRPRTNYFVVSGEIPLAWKVYLEH